MATAEAVKSGTDSYVLVAALKIAIVGALVVNIATFVYGFTFGLFSWVKLHEILSSDGFTTALTGIGLTPEDFIQALVQMTVTPVAAGVMTATFPFLGAWLYLGVPAQKTTSVGLLTVLIYVSINMALAVAMNPALLSALGNVFGLIGLSVGLSLIYLYGFLLMGIGFNLAKVFKLKPTEV